MTDQEINEAVARELGWKAWQEGLDPKNYVWVDSQGNEANDGCPDYCTSIAAAWEILEKLAKANERKGGGPILSVEHDGRWHCRLGPIALTLDDPNVEQADTAPMAIALAFLKLEGQ